MVQKAMDSTVTSSDFYTVFDNVVATNPQLNQTIQDVRNETKLFLVKILRFYTYRDMAYVQELGTKKKYYCHITHEMLSYEVSFNCMCDGTVESDNVYGTYVKPFNPIYGVVADVRFKGNTDEKCLLSCLNYGNNKELKSDVRNGEVKLVSGESSVSLTRNRINIVTPRLFVNGLPYDEPKLANYYDKTDMDTTLSLLKSDTDAQIEELNDKISHSGLPCGFHVVGNELVIDYCEESEGEVDGSILDLINSLEARITDMEHGEINLDSLGVNFDVRFVGTNLPGDDDRIMINIDLTKGV